MLCILTALDLCNFQQYCIVLQWVKESSRRGDVTAKAAAEWWTGAGRAGHAMLRFYRTDLTDWPQSVRRESVLSEPLHSHREGTFNSFVVSQNVCGCVNVKELSSAYITTFPCDKCCVRSLVNSKNKTGPKTEPCTMPCVTLTGCDDPIDWFCPRN